MSARVPVGVVGVGSLGYHHARVLADCPPARLVGVYDIDGARADRVAAEFGCRAYPALEALLADVHAVTVAVPTTAHHAVARAALDRGVHVLVEKPIASTLEEARDLVARADAAGRVLQVGHIERFNAAVRACEPYLERPLFVESHRLAPFGPRGTDVAVVLDLMIHDIDLVLSLVHGEVVSVTAVGVPVLTRTVDIANARIEFANGAVANITASRVSVERQRKIRFFQPSGYLSLDLAEGRGRFYRRKRSAPPAEPAVAWTDVVEAVEIVGDGREPLRLEMESFLRAVRGEAPPAVTGAEGLRALEVALHIVRTIEEKLRRVVDPAAT